MSTRQGRAKVEEAKLTNALDALERSRAEAMTLRVDAAKSADERNRMANEIADLKTKVRRLERVVRGLRDAFIAATEEDAPGAPFAGLHSPR